MEAKRFQAAVSRSYDLPYWLHRPDELAEPSPLVLFLHGAGERGDDLDRVAVHGPPKQIAAGQQLPFILAAPQCPTDSWWTWQEEALDALLDELLTTHPVDPERVYLTGLSMGGIGAWQLAARYPERFAAVVPICGNAGPWMARRLVGLPIWAFHNEDDPVVPVTGTTRMVAALEQLGGDVRATIKPTGGHDSWTAAYDDPALYDWMLGQRRS
ncbi:alpha/beta fold hydrolase [Microlunatus sp. Gsoil 973]|uniref:carboxylesterase family protein n=1 Tax=Microlunatus sp. Gsoil 973 TaxID=2672569 RepID=UPI0012B47D46|nr:alpha/beta fold hydrolase [Microlunatus sp. Gsoil 973]QGN33830.1 phospholipase [Microlunatus sp. Gsoil 973]